MRCAKCGYVSFDYLSECKKCETSLKAARDGFGFMGGKPAVPSLLASLITGGETSAQPEESVAQTEEFASLSFEKEPAGVQFLQEEDASATEDVISAIANPVGAENEDFSLLDLSDEEVELLIGNESLRSGDMDILSGNAAEDKAGRAAEPPSTPEPAPQGLEMSPHVGDAPLVEEQEPGGPFSNPEDSPQGLEAGTEIDPILDDLAADFTGDLTKPGEDPQSPAESEPRSVQSGPQSDDSADDFVIELSENDLESLLNELGTTPKGTA